MTGNSCTELRCSFKNHAKDVKTLKLRDLAKVTECLIKNRKYLKMAYLQRNHHI